MWQYHTGGSLYYVNFLIRSVYVVIWGVPHSMTWSLRGQEILYTQTAGISDELGHKHKRVEGYSRRIVCVWAVGWLSGGGLGWQQGRGWCRLILQISRKKAKVNTFDTQKDENMRLKKKKKRGFVVLLLKKTTSIMKASRIK